MSWDDDEFVRLQARRTDIWNGVWYILAAIAAGSIWVLAIVGICYAIIAIFLP